MQIFTKEQIAAQNQGINDAKAGLPCDASSIRVTATYYGKYVNDYYKGYKLGFAEMKLEARNEDYQSTILEDSTDEIEDLSYDGFPNYESAWA
jgi:hypothetical protein